MDRTQHTNVWLVKSQSEFLIMTVGGQNKFSKYCIFYLNIYIFRYKVGNNNNNDEHDDGNNIKQVTLSPWTWTRANTTNNLANQPKRREEERGKQGEQEKNMYSQKWKKKFTACHKSATSCEPRCVYMYLNEYGAGAGPLKTTSKSKNSIKFNFGFGDSQRILILILEQKITPLCSKSIAKLTQNNMVRLVGVLVWHLWSLHLYWSHWTHIFENQLGMALWCTLDVWPNRAQHLFAVIDSAECKN